MRPYPVFDLNTYRDQWNKNEGFLYFEWKGNSLIVDEPHVHDFFMLLLLETSDGHHSIDFVNHKAKGFQLHILFPGQVHYWQLAADTVAHQLMISKDNFGMIASAFRFNTVVYEKYPVIDLSKAEYNKLLYEFKSIKLELAGKPILWEGVFARARLIALAASRKLEMFFKDRQVLTTSTILFKYINLVDLHFREQKNLQYYAAQLHITINYLNILCNKHFNKTAAAIIRDRIILEAKRQLTLPGKSIKEIAYNLGFSDLGNFSNFFRVHTGSSPRAFKDNN